MTNDTLQKTAPPAVGEPRDAAPVRVEPAQLSVLWQLGARARAAASEQELAFTVVNETLSLMPYRQAALWRGPAPGVVSAVSGLPQTDQGTPYVQWLTGVSRALARAAGTPAAGGVGLRAFTSHDLPPEAAPLAEEWAAWWPAHGLWVPLADRAGQPLGALLFARDTVWTPTERALLAELSLAWSHAFVAFHPRAPLNTRLRAWLKPGRALRRVLAGLALVCVLPVPLSVLAPAEVTPRDPFVVRAPLDGVIDRLYVQPNQRVEPGTPLLALEATTLQSRYDVARKDYDTAQEEYRQTAQRAVTEDKDRLDMALRKGKLEDSAVELEYSAQQLARIKVSANRAGVAVFADANDLNGRAVAVGEKVLAIADPAAVEVTAWLPVADNVDVRPGGTLTLYPKSSPLDAYDATIATVAYRAEPTPEGVLAYRVKARLAAGAHPPLGSMGTARLHGRWVPLAYYVLRRPLTLARQWLGW